jgi:hypothetical protein
MMFLKEQTSTSADTQANCKTSTQGGFWWEDDTRVYQDLHRNVGCCMEYWMASEFCYKVIMRGGLEVGMRKIDFHEEKFIVR